MRKPVVMLNKWVLSGSRRFVCIKRIWIPIFTAIVEVARGSCRTLASICCGGRFEKVEELQLFATIGFLGTM